MPAQALVGKPVRAAQQYPFKANLEQGYEKDVEVFRPVMTRCLCGCADLSLGVKFVMLTELLKFVLYICIVFGNVVLDFDVLGHAISPAFEIALFAFSLVGVCMSVIGLLGMPEKIEGYLRAFLGFFLVSCIVDLVLILYLLIFQDPQRCGIMHYMAGELLAAFGGGRGAAMSCGVSRMLTLCLVVLVVALQAYFILVILSLCQEIALGGMHALTDLLFNKVEAATAALEFADRNEDDYYGRQGYMVGMSSTARAFRPGTIDYYGTGTAY